jgi:hypothetical protein
VFINRFEIDAGQSTQTDPGPSADIRAALAQASLQPPPAQTVPQAVYAATSIQPGSGITPGIVLPPGAIIIPQNHPQTPSPAHNVGNLNSYSPLILLIISSCFQM